MPTDLSTSGSDFLILALLVIAATLAGLPLLARLVHAIAPVDEGGAVNWSWRELALVLLLAVVWPFPLMTFVTVLHPWSAELRVLVLSSLALGLPAVAACVIASRQGPGGIGALGIRAGFLLRAPLAGVLLYALTFPALGAVMLLWQAVLRSWGTAELEQDVIRYLADMPSDQRFAALLLGAYVQPLFEEILFRGFLQPVLVRWARPLGGIVLTSIVFASLHGLAAGVPVFALSCVLGYVMLKTRRLHAVWAIHALHNGLQFFFLYAAPDTFRPH